MFSMNTFQSCIRSHFLSVITNKRILAKGRKREVPVIGMNRELIRKKGCELSILCSHSLNYLQQAYSVEDLHEDRFSPLKLQSQTVPFHVILEDFDFVLIIVVVV